MNETLKTKHSDEDVLRYVSGEMSAQEETIFEGQLEHDQHLREQVATMVCGLTAVHRVFAESPVTLAVKKSSVNRSIKSSVLRIVTSLAAMVLLAALAISIVGRQANKPETDSIAIAWAESLSSEEFELLEDMEELEFVSFDFENDDDWVYEVVDATRDDIANLN